MKSLILISSLLISGSFAFADCGSCSGDAKNDSKYSCSKDAHKEHKDHKKHNCSKGDKENCKKKHHKKHGKHKY